MLPLKKPDLHAKIEHLPRNCAKYEMIPAFLRAPPPIDHLPWSQQPPIDGNGRNLTNQSRNLQNTSGNPKIPEDPGSHGSNLQKTSDNPKIPKYPGNHGSNLQKTSGKSENPKDPGNYARNLQITSGNPKIRKSESSATMGRPPPIDANGNTPTNQSRNLQKNMENRTSRKIRATMSATCKKPREIRKSERSG